MTFQSPLFLLAFGLALALRLAIPSEGGRKLLVVATGLLFYATWDAAFLPMLLLYTLVGWGAGLWIAGLREDAARRAVVALGTALFLGLLAFFKYRGFAAETLARIGLVPAPQAFPMAPIGISFFTFELISYLVDLKRRQTPPIRRLLDFATFFLFLPRMISGPIVRPADFLAQLQAGALRGRPPLLRGAELFLAGVVFKTVVADSQLRFVEEVFASPLQFDAATAALAAAAYAVQIFGDFFGYSLMAAGLARGFGFTLPRNFAAPYAAAGFSDFWRRWHISLSGWLRDYLYIPLGGSRGGEARTARNLMLTMLLGGLWHGPAWNFVLWGGAHGALLAAEREWRRRFGPARAGGAWRHGLAVGGTALIVCLLWIPFRAPGLEGTVAMFGALAGFGGLNQWISPWAVFGVAAVALFHWAHEANPGVRRFFDAEAPGGEENWRFVALGATAASCLVWAQSVPTGFIYFQF
jgi:alginate O-acetyltransferase complex protein AlgI